jgi:hypothetical protein
VLQLADSMSGAATYTEAAAIADEVLAPDNGLLVRLQEFFEAAAEQANAFEDIEGWELADRFHDAAAQIGELSEELADSADELRALGPPTPARKPGAAHRSAAAPSPAVAALPAPRPGPRSAR